MPPPPPPPPPLLSAPPPPPPPVSSVNGKGQSSAGQGTDRNALLSQIRTGTKLKKATTNDKSAPAINGKSTKQCAPSVNNNNKTAPQQSSAPFGLGDLFAQGMPKLRATNQSFLQGGAYKSQLSPRPNVNNESFPKSSSSRSLLKQQESSKSNEHIVDPAFSKSSIIDEPDASVKPNSNVNSGSLASRPQPPSSNRKPNFHSATILKTSAVKSILQKNSDMQLSGSEPNLSMDSSTKPRSSSKPQPPPRAFQKNNASISPIQLNIDLKYRSYEDSDVLSKSEAKVFEKANSFTLRPQMLNNRSEPSNLNMIAQNGSTQSPVAPARQHNRRDRPVKPTTAPPPLPVRTTSNYNTLPNPSRSMVRAPPNAPPPPPCMSSLPSATSNMPPPPPPPPRILQQTAPAINSRTLPLIPKTMPVINSMQSAGTTGFETRFAFRKNSEFMKPEVFSNKTKTYPSKIASERRPQQRKVRQPPPQVPPPPPPVRTG